MTLKKNLLSLVSLLAVASIAFVACTKDNGPTTTPTPLTRSQVLVKYNWQVDEVWRNISGVNSHYIRGGINTTGTNYDVMRLTFKADSTGTYIDENAIIHTTTWKFTSADQHNMLMTIISPNPGTDIWNLVEISDSTFTSTTAVGSNTLVSARYVPVR